MTHTYSEIDKLLTDFTNGAISKEQMHARLRQMFDMTAKNNYSEGYVIGRNESEDSIKEYIHQLLFKYCQP